MATKLEQIFATKKAIQTVYRVEFMDRFGEHHLMTIHRTRDGYCLHGTMRVGGPKGALLSGGTDWFNTIVQVRCRLKEIEGNYGGALSDFDQLEKCYESWSGYVRHFDGRK